MPIQANNRIKIVFAGTPEFAVPFLKSFLTNSNFEVSAVITQPDKPSGRKQLLTPSPIKTIASEHKLMILQPETLKNNQAIIDQLKSLDYDLMIVVAYGQIIPRAILDLSKSGNINVHPSLLPKYRGASPIQSAILNGEPETGITIMLMDEKMDHGPILFQHKISLTGEETNSSLHEQLAEIGAPLLIEIVNKYLSGSISPREQDHEQATFCVTIDKADARIDWQQPALAIKRKIYAFYPWPATWTTIGGKRLKIFPPVELKAIDPQRLKGLMAGQIIIENSQMGVICKDNALVANRLQLEGKNETTAAEFIRGYKNLSAKILQ